MDKINPDSLHKGSYKAVAREIEVEIIIVLLLAGVSKVEDDLFLP